MGKKKGADFTLHQFNKCKIVAPLHFYAVVSREKVWQAVGNLGGVMCVNYINLINVKCCAVFFFARNKKGIF